MKRFVSLAVILAILCAISPMAFAYENIYIAKTAYIQNVDSKGSQLNSDAIDEGKNTVSDTTLKIRQEGENLKISFELGNDAIELSAFPEGTSENGNILYYSSNTNIDKYEVMSINFEKNIKDSAMYFKKYYDEHKEYTSMLKIYLKKHTPGNDNRNYMIIELFGYEPHLIENTIEKYASNQMIDEWYGKEFEPISKTVTKEHNPAMLTFYPKPDSQTYTLSETFPCIGDEVGTHTLTLLFHCDPQNIRVGSSAEQDFTVRIEGKSMSFPSAPNMNSNTASYLHVSSAELNVQALDNTAVKSITVNGEYNGSIFDKLSASIGIGLGPIGVSLDIEDIIENYGRTDLNNHFENFINGVDGKYTRSVSVKFNHKLSYIGNFFTASVNLKDYGYTPLDGQLIGLWKLDILIMEKMEHKICVGGNTINMSIIP